MLKTVIDNGTKHGIYKCYIDTEYIEYPVGSDVSCTIVGHDYTIYSGSSVDALSYSYKANNVLYLGNRYTYWLKFTTPMFSGVSSKITFNIALHSFVSTAIYNCAICTSDANYAKYLPGVYPVDDQYQVVYTTSELSGVTGSLTIDIDTDKLNQSTTYYLVIWYNKDDVSYTISADCSKHTVTLVSEGVDDPIYSSKFESYTPYIDTGTSWEIL